MTHSGKWEANTKEHSEQLTFLWVTPCWSDKTKSLFSHTHQVPECWFFVTHF